jgi:hypothetical protein
MECPFLIISSKKQDNHWEQVSTETIKGQQIIHDPLKKIRIFVLIKKEIAEDLPFPKNSDF